MPLINEPNTRQSGALVPVAEYVRMSTEHQQYSTQNQGAKIREYADRHGYLIVRTYADDGKSGLRLDGRAGLKQLLCDVEAGAVPFKAVLVYDISRWGRFQDADESAYYEYRCRRAGLQIVYCAEQFDNDGSPTATIIKSVKRAMAGEYSRELSTKVFAGQCRLVELGFRQGGSAGFGLRRLLVDQHGNRKAELLRGERKSLQTDRVILIPGPADELDTVRGIYSRFVQGQNEQQIANALNGQGLRNAFGRPWRSGSVREVLTNEKYIGANVYNRKSFKLKRNHVTNPPEMWIRKDDAFENVVAVDLYAQAQLRIQQQSKRLTDDEILEELRRVQEKSGRLSGIVIDEDGTLTSTLVQSRFGGLHRAYTLIGYTPERDFSYLEINRNIRLLHPGIMEVAYQKLTSRGGSAQPGERPDLVSVNGEFDISISISRCRLTPTGTKRWVVRLNPSGADINLAVRLDADNKNMLDFYLLPRMALEGNRLTLKDFNHANVESFRFDSLDGLSSLAARTEMRMVS